MAGGARTVELWLNRTRDMAMAGGPRACGIMA